MTQKKKKKEKKEKPHGNFSLLIIVLTAEWWKGVGPGGGEHLVVAFTAVSLGGRDGEGQDCTETLEASQSWPLINLNDYVTEFVMYKVLRISEKDFS